MPKIVPMRVSKGPMLRRMDRLARSPDTMRKAMTELQNRDDSILDVGLRHTYVEDRSDEREHVEHWTGAPATEATLRAGFIRAAQRGLDLGLPVDSYWVRAANPVEVAVLVSPVQVTMLIIGEYPAEFAPGEALPEEGIDIVR